MPRSRSVLSGLVALASGVVVALAASSSPASGAAAVAVPSPTVVPSPGFTSGTGTVTLSGRVTDDDGVAVAGIGVHAYGSGSGSASTDPSGAWTIPALPSGGYRVEFRPPIGSDLVGEYWDDAGSYLSATYVRVADGDVVTGLDAQLAETAVVRGRVTDASGAPVAGASVSLERTDLLGGIEVGASTRADGTYEVWPLAAGTYRLRVVPEPGTGLSTTYWSGVADAAAATPITLEAGQVLDGIDVTALPAQGLAGRVRLPAGVEMSEVRVVVHQVLRAGSVVVAGTTPAADGAFRFDDLVAGSYLVHVEHVEWNGPLLPEYYRDATAPERAVPVEVAAGTVVTGITLTPLLAGRITGVVTGADGPVPGVEVTLVPRSGEVGTWGLWTTGPDGRFLIGRLPAGSYSVRLTSPDGSVRYFRAPAGTTHDLRTATRVKVRTGQAVEISARLRG
ncbi:MSCRAMM family protein [Cellulomonas sp. P5_C5]